MSTKSINSSSGSSKSSSENVSNNSSGKKIDMTKISR